MNAELTHKLNQLRDRLSEMGSVLVAFSGGVDSALVLLVAVRTLGAEHVLAVTGRSPSVPAGELRAVEELAREIGVAHEWVDTHEMDNPDYRSNPSNRCYFCKTELYDHLCRLATDRNLHAVVNGVNADDLGDYRPGLEAAAERDVRAPLADCGISKSELRQLAVHYGLSIHDKPASPCLSSRVQYGEAISPEKLARIDAAETFLREQGFRELRVRHHDDLARIEVPASEIARFAEPELRERIESHLRSLGYRYITLDLRGFRSGSMNEVLPARVLHVL